jgi:hypothetical protein
MYNSDTGRNAYMSTHSRARPALTLILSAAAATLAMLPAPARADVTVGEKTSMNLAGINIDINATERTTADKQRSDSTVQCHGFLSLFCHDVEGGRIVRLDKRLEWQLEPKKQLYTEHPFPTAAQRAAAQKELDAAMEEMKKCPMPQAQNVSQRGPDTSRCQLSSPVLNVTPTDEHATIAGHDTHKTNVVLSQTCTDTKTGDVCEIDYGFETWLTTDTIPGVEERTAFTKKYLAEQGLDPNNPQLQHTVRQFMAPYADQLKQLKGKAGDLKGYPLRTTFYMAFGGPHCGKAKQAAQQQQASRSSPFNMGNIASHALASGFSSLFHRGAAAIHTDSAGGAAASSAANDAADSTANAASGSMTAQSSSAGSTAPAQAPGALVRVVTFTTETTSIDNSSIPADEFEIPAGWKLKPPPQGRTAEKTPKCPSAGR